MRDLILLLIHLIVTITRLFTPGGTRSVVAESLLVKHQLLILNRSRERAPNLRPLDRVIAGLGTGFMRPTRLLRSAIVLKPSTLLSFHRALVKRKYRLLFTPKRRGKPGPKGPSPELVTAIVEMKQRNPRFGCRRIAQQISLIFGIDLDKDTVRRILIKHYRPEPGSGGPSWLTFIGHSKDSLGSVDLFRCESLILKSHWVLIVMDHFTRRVIGISVDTSNVDGPAVCRLFAEAISGEKSFPAYLSSDNDSLFRFHRWQANLRILEIKEVKTVPYVPLAHPFIERLIGTVRREFLDLVPFWNARDLEKKLFQFIDYYNQYRVHRGLDGATPDPKPRKPDGNIARLGNYQWKSHCRGLYQLPEAA